MSILAPFINWLAGRPAKTLLNIELGRFESDDDVWKTAVRHGNETFQLSLAGSHAQPDPQLLQAAVSLLSQFDNLRQTALLFLLAEDALTPTEELACFALDLLWLERPGDFTLEFCLPADEEDLWRVQFLSGSPKYVTHDF